MKTLKLLTIFSVIMLLFNGCAESDSQDVNKNDLTKENLKGKVRFIVQNTFEAVEEYGEVVKLSYPTLSFEDAFKTNYPKSKKLFFNNKGYLKEEIDVSFHFDNKGYLVFTPFWAFYTYNENGLLIEKSYYKDGRELFQKDVLKYNEQGTKTEEYTYHYDSNRELSEGKKVFKYNDKGVLIESNYHNKKETKTGISTTYKYNKKGLLSEEKGMLNTTFYKYNDRNELIEIESTFLKKTNITTYEYVRYDENENWIKRLEFQNGEPLFITEREIKYY